MNNTSNNRMIIVRGTNTLSVARKLSVVANPSYTKDVVGFISTVTLFVVGYILLAV